MGNLVDSLKKHANDRRTETYSAHLSKSDHPECVSISEISTTDANKQKSKSNNCSEFYWACRNNDIGKVRKLLGYMAMDDIDQIEPNGSTALHAACFQGHRDIVELLLKTGADRAISNSYNCLPFNEAKTAQIKELFFRVPNSNRLVSNTGAIDWELINDTVLETVAEERDIIKSFNENANGHTSIERMPQRIEKNYNNGGWANFNGIDVIRRVFQKATKEQDPKWIIKAYTAETDFYKILNREIAYGATSCQNERRYIIALLWHHPVLDELSFTGSSYRVVQINNDNLRKYQVCSSLMIKSFLSSSVDRKVAEWFVVQQQLISKENNDRASKTLNGTLIKSWVMCIYKIKHRRTA